jgi:hypothetical protein
MGAVATDREKFCAFWWLVTDTDSAKAWFAAMVKDRLAFVNQAGRIPWGSHEVIALLRGAQPLQSLRSRILTLFPAAGYDEHGPVWSKIRLDLKYSLSFANCRDHRHLKAKFQSWEGPFAPITL